MQHTQLASGAWNKLSFVEQMANIGSEVERTLKWQEKHNTQFSYKAFARGFELVSLTIECHSGDAAKLKELSRLKELLADSVVFENTYRSSNESWRKYFRAFNWAARSNHS